MMLTMLLGFSACNNEDDVMEIFNDKTWKLSRITTEKGKEQFYQGLWSNEAEEESQQGTAQDNRKFHIELQLCRCERRGDRYGQRPMPSKQTSATPS